MINRLTVGLIAPILMLVCFSEFIWWMELESTLTTATFISINILLFLLQIITCSVVHTPYMISLGGYCLATIVIIVSQKGILFQEWSNLYGLLLVMVYGVICLIEFKQKQILRQNFSQKRR